MKINQNIKILIQKFVENKCTQSEIDALVAYFKRNQIDHEFPQVDEVLEMLSELPKMDEDSAQRIYNQILEKANTKESLKRRKRIYKYGVVAAIVFIVLGGAFYFGLMKRDQNIRGIPVASENSIILEMEGGKSEVLLEYGQLQLTDKNGQVVGSQNGHHLVYRKNEKPSKEIEYNTLYIPYGKKFQVELSDGTSVMMNAGSSLRFPVNFPIKGKRTVFLTGEAFFKVAKEEKKPFIVHVENLEIGVLGTEFNVSAYPEDPTSKVVLVEGSVKLSSREKNAVLEPGQMGRLERDANTLDIKNVETEIYTAWMQGDLVFRNMSFENILMKMERHYNVKIINNNEILAKEKFNARFDDEPLTKILEYFKKTYGLNYKRQDDETIIIN